MPDLLTKLERLGNTLPSVEDFQKFAQSTLKLIANAQQRFFARAEEVFDDLSDRVDRKLARVKDGYTPIKGRDYFDGKDGKPGEKGDPGHTPSESELISLITPLIPPAIKGNDGSPDTAEDIRNKLELLEGEDRLKIEAIRDLREELDKLLKRPSGTTVIGANHPLWQLQDVDVAGITTGQSIKWDGVRWIPFTPAGGANTPVYNEVPTGSDTSFTLANTPVSGTDRVYARGQRLTPTTDYTLSGTTITTVLSWSTSDLTVDYEYA